MNAGVVLAALDRILEVAEDQSIHPQVRASIVRNRLKRLRHQVAERVEEASDSRAVILRAVEDDLHVRPEVFPVGLADDLADVVVEAIRESSDSGSAS